MSIFDLDFHELETLAKQKATNHQEVLVVRLAKRALRSENKLNRIERLIHETGTYNSLDQIVTEHKILLMRLNQIIVGD